MKKVLLLLLVVLVAGPGFSQEAGTAAVPFVSKLKARAVESEILLSWLNPNNLQGSVLVYRHSAEIGRDNLDEATLIAKLTAPQQSFQDTPPEDEPYYYAVLIEDSSGTVQKLLVPLRNKTSRPVRISVLPPVESTAARITGIRATVADDAVRVEFSVSNPDRELLLFRNNSPMSSTEDLLDAFAPRPLERGTTYYIDYPAPGVEAYYAVVDAGLFKLARQELIPGESATVRPVLVPLEVQRAALPPAAVEARANGAAAEAPPEERQPPVAPSRAITPSWSPAETTPPPPAGQSPAAVALPYLQPAREGGTGLAGLPRKVPLDPETRAAVARLLSMVPPVRAAQSSVALLPEDRDTPAAGESAGLQEILRETLLPGDYGGAESRLRGFLNLERAPYTEARARFYLGQAYYFQGLYEEALLEFVLSQGELYAPVQPWLQSCFRRLWNKS